MFSKDATAVYNRLLILGVLCACLAVFSSSTLTEKVFGALYPGL
jgi:hypothetical protein